MTQPKQAQWLEQWQVFHDDELFLFLDWIFPNSLEDFAGKSVLEAGCGGGQHTSFIAPYAQSIVAVDLNSVDVARVRNAASGNITFVEADVAEMNLGQAFDVVFSVGVVHHTDDPDITVENLIRHLKPGGRLILWVYSKEGNWIAERVVEAFRKWYLSRLSTRTLVGLSVALTFTMYFPIYTIYMLPFRYLPYFDYFQNFRRLSFNRNTLNVFDKLNAPQVCFIDRERIRSWFNSSRFEDVHVESYRGVSWRASGTLRSPSQ